MERSHEQPILGLSTQLFRDCTHGCCTRTNFGRSAHTQVAEPLDIHASMVSNVIVWGNATSSSVLDVLHGSVHGQNRLVPLRNCVDEELAQIISRAVQERSEAIVEVSSVSFNQIAAVFCAAGRLPSSIAPARHAWACGFDIKCNPRKGAPCQLLLTI